MPFHEKKVLINWALLNLRTSVYKKKPIRVKRKTAMSEMVFAIHESKKDSCPAYIKNSNRKANRKMSKRFEEELLEIQKSKRQINV